MILLPLVARADCVSPPAAIGSYSYNSGKYQLCDGASWRDFVCVASGVGSCVTLGACGSAGALDYDIGQASYKVCGGSTWVRVGVDDADQIPPTGCPIVGNECSDGSIFVGDGNLYVASTNSTSSKRWSTVAGDTTADSTTDGEANQENILGSGVNLAGTGFELCANMVMHGHSDWYLPSRSELTRLYNNRAAIDANADVPLGTYGFFSSTEKNSTEGWFRSFSTGAESGISKTMSYSRVRCVRRQASSENTRTCSSGAGVLDYDGSRNILRFCDGTYWKALGGNVPGSDVEPDDFSFGDVGNVGLNTVVTAGPIVISGIDNTAVVSVSGDGNPQVLSDFMGGWANPGTVENFQQLRVRVTSSSEADTARTVIVTVGSVSVPWTVTTSALGECDAGAVSLGGHCWYLGTSNQDCNSVCGSHGGCDLAGTKDYAGSGGTLGNCSAVLNALGQSGPASSGFDMYGWATYGCFNDESFNYGFGNTWLSSPTTTCAGGELRVNRACACNN